MAQREPLITIDGHKLTNAQSMAVRVAITNFHRETADMYALGTDTHGVAMCTAYHLRLGEVLKIILVDGEQRKETC